MTNRTKAVRLFEAERDLKAARKRVKTLEAKCGRLAKDLEGTIRPDGLTAKKEIPLREERKAAA